MEEEKIQLSEAAYKRMPYYYESQVTKIDWMLIGMSAMFMYSFAQLGPYAALATFAMLIAGKFYYQKKASEDEKYYVLKK
jgi:hypothetical protein